MNRINVSSRLHIEDSAVTERPIRRCRSMMGILVASVFSIAGLSTSQGQNLVGLGASAEYAVLGNNLNFSNVTVNGDEGFGTSGSINIMSPSSIHDDLYMDTGATQFVSGLITDSIYQPYAIDMALSDGLAASQFSAGLSPDIILSSVSAPLLMSFISEPSSATLGLIGSLILLRRRKN